MSTAANTKSTTSFISSASSGTSVRYSKVIHYYRRTTPHHGLLESLRGALVSCLRRSHEGEDDKIPQEITLESIYTLH